MGMRLRLKSSYDISGFSTQMQVILIRDEDITD